MGLGKKKGHVQGSQVSGGHTTLIDGADSVIKKLGVLSWFESVRPGIISVAKGGKPSVTIRRPADTTHVNCKRRSKSAAAGRAKSESPEVVFLLIGRARLPR